MSSYHGWTHAPKEEGGTDPIPGLVTEATESLTFKHISLGTSGDKETAVAEAATLTGYYFSNSHPSAVRFMKLWNKASDPVPGSDTGSLKLSLPLPPLAGATVGLDKPIPFSSGIAFAIRAGVADTDDTNVVADEVVINLFYFLGVV